VEGDHAAPGGIGAVLGGGVDRAEAARDERARCSLTSTLTSTSALAG
jgi:hypothetical protein